jgi:DNA polymerase-1
MTWGEYRYAYHGHREPRPELLDELLVRNPPRVISVDFETVSLKDTTPIGIGIGISPSESFYFSLNPPCAHIPWKLLQDPKVKKVWHNGLFDLGTIPNIENIVDVTNIADTAVMAKYCGLPMGLKDDAQLILGREIKEISDVLPKGHDMLSLPPRVVAAKCCDDVEATIGIYQVLMDMVEPDGEPSIHRKSLDVDMALLPILVKMGKRGIRLDQTRVRAHYERLTKECAYYKDICAGEGFNPGSTQQVAYILMSRGQWLPVKRKRDKKKLRPELRAVADKEALLTCTDPLATVVLEFRSAQKLLGTYVKPAMKLERMHTRFGLNTATSRLSSSARNLQNIPLSMRDMFIPDSDCFTGWDCSQVELRVLAHVSHDPEMLYIFESGGDIHQATADDLGIPRKLAKNVNFSVVYGADTQTIMETAGITDPRRAEELAGRWKRKFRSAWEWIADTQQEGLRNRWVKTLGGRKLYLPLEGEEQDIDVARKAVNYPIQGTAAEVIKAQMLLIAKVGGGKIVDDMVLQIHDEQLFDGDWLETINSVDLAHVTQVYTPIETKKMERWGNG